MNKYDLIKILNFASKNFDVDNGIGHWLDFEDPQNSFTSEQIVEKYIKEHPLEKRCECITDSSYVAEENEMGEMIDYCCKCKAQIE